jgi:hypothetical protein
VPRVEFACCRVGCDSDMTAAGSGRAALRLLSESGTCACRELVRLHGIGNQRATHGTTCVLVGDGECSCERDACRARRRLVVRGGDWSEGLPLAGNWSEKLPTSQEQDVLLVMVLTGVFSRPRLESWPLCCQWCQKTPPQEQLSRRQRGP